MRLVLRLVVAEILRLLRKNLRIIGSLACLCRESATIAGIWREECRRIRVDFGSESALDQGFRF